MWPRSANPLLKTGNAAPSMNNEGEPALLGVLEDPVAFFYQHGFSCVRGVASTTDAQSAAIVVQGLQEQIWGAGTSSTQGRQMKRSLLWRLDEAPTEVMRLIGSSAVRELAYAAHGTTNVRFAAWVIFHRPAGAEGTFWHTDAGHMAFGGNIVQFWMPLTTLPNEQGLKFRGDLGQGENIYSFDHMRPGDASLHRQTTPHAGQTYSAPTTGLSFITFEDGALLEDHDFPVYHVARQQMIDRLFPTATFGDAARSDHTPYLHEFSA